MANEPGSVAVFTVKASTRFSGAGKIPWLGVLSARDHPAKLGLAGKKHP